MSISSGFVFFNFFFFSSLSYLSILFLSSSFLFPLLSLSLSLILLPFFSFFTLFSLFISFLFFFFFFLMVPFNLSHFLTQPLDVLKYERWFNDFTVVCSFFVYTISSYVFIFLFNIHRSFLMYASLKHPSLI